MSLVVFFLISTIKHSPQPFYGMVKSVYLFKGEVHFILESQGWFNTQKSINVIYHVHKLKSILMIEVF